MRVTRQKRYRRSLKFFRLNFGFQEPYKVLIDGTFTVNALREKIPVKEMLPKMLGGRVTPCTTGCVLAELRSLKDKGMHGAVIAKSYYRVKCAHTEPVSASQCVREQIGPDNVRKFIVATQDMGLTKQLRRVAGVPLIRMTQQVPFLEMPSNSSRDAGEADEKKRQDVASWETSRLPALKQQKQDEQAKAEAKAKRFEKAKKKGPKGVNPLSCRTGKKKKKAAEAATREQPRATSEVELLEAQKPKRARSRRMGTRTRVEAEELSSASRAGAPPGAAGLLAAPATRPPAAPSFDEGVAVAGEQHPATATAAIETDTPPGTPAKRKSKRRRD